MQTTASSFCLFIWSKIKNDQIIVMQPVKLDFKNLMQNWSGRLLQKFEPDLQKHELGVLFSWNPTRIAKAEFCAAEVLQIVVVINTG